MNALNRHTPIIKAAAAAAVQQIQKTGGVWSEGDFGAAAPPENLTDSQTGKHAFMIGFDWLGDPEITFKSDGGTYDFGN